MDYNYYIRFAKVCPEGTWKPDLNSKTDEKTVRQMIFYFI